MPPVLPVFTPMTIRFLEIEGDILAVMLSSASDSYTVVSEC